MSDRYCADLMDVASAPPVLTITYEEIAGNTGAFVPGHVIRYFLGAVNALGQWSYLDNGHPLYTMEGQGAADPTTSLATAIQRGV